MRLMKLIILFVISKVLRLSHDNLDCPIYSLLGGENIHEKTHTHTDSEITGQIFTGYVWMIFEAVFFCFFWNYFSFSSLFAVVYCVLWIWNKLRGANNIRTAPTAASKHMYDNHIMEQTKEENEIKEKHINVRANAIPINK